MCLLRQEFHFQNDEKRVSKLDDEQEFDTVIDLFIQRNKDIII